MHCSQLWFPSFPWSHWGVSVPLSNSVTTPLRPTWPLREQFMITTLRRFIIDDHGQDLVEYALLSALIGVTGIVAWINVGTAIAAAYGSWDTNVQTLSAC